MFGLKYYEGANPGKRKWELVKIDDEKKKQKSTEYERQKERDYLVTVGQKTESGWNMTKKIKLWHVFCAFNIIVLTK